MNRTAQYSAACCFVVLLSLVGCRQSDGMIEVTGVVTYDGRPLENGILMLLPADGNGPTAQAVVTDGKYVVQVVPGKKKAQIEGFKVVAQRPLVSNDPAGPKIDVTEQFLPPRYNRQSELTCDITANMPAFDLALQSDPLLPSH